MDVLLIETVEAKVREVRKVNSCTALLLHMFSIFLLLDVDVSTS